MTALFNRLQWAYGSMSFCQTVLHNLFLLYYVEVFVSVYKISQAAFWIGEVRMWSEVQRERHAVGFPWCDHVEREVQHTH